MGFSLLLVGRFGVLDQTVPRAAHGTTGAAAGML